MQRQADATKRYFDLRRVCGPVAGGKYLHSSNFTTASADGYATVPEGAGGGTDIDDEG